MKVCIVGCSGKLGLYMVDHCLARGYEVTGVCRPESVSKLERFKGRLAVFAGRTDERSVVAKAVDGCDAVLVVLAPLGVHNYASQTAQAVLDSAKPGARLVFSCGWHITRDKQDKYSRLFLGIVACIGAIAKAVRFADLGDQVRACDLIFNSGTRWTVVRGSDLEEGPSEGLPIWSEHVHDATLKRNLMRRVDFALFMVHAATDDSLVQKAPAITGQTPNNPPARPS